MTVDTFANLRYTLERTPDLTTGTTFYRIGVALPE